MPPIYKVLVSLLVVLIAVAAHYFRQHIGLGASAALVGGLVAIMLIGLWAFPEPKKEKRGKR